MCSENPKLFDAGVYDVLRVDAAAGEVEVALDCYKRLVVQPEVATGVNQLSVSALVIAPDARGRACVLIGKRGLRTRMYGGMWQICPAGGVEPASDELREFGAPELSSQLERELEEEVGMRLGGLRPRPVAIVHDPVAHSYDIVMRVDFDEPCPPRPKRGSGWEHEEIRWVPLEELPQFCQRERVIDATRALFRSMGWLGG